MRYTYLFLAFLLVAGCQGKPEGSESAGGNLSVAGDSQPADNTEIVADTSERRSPASNPGD